MDKYQITAINNTAASFIEIGDTRSAINILRTAIKWSQQTLARVNESYYVKSPSIMLEDCMKYSEEYHKTDHDIQEGCLIFKQPIYIPKTYGTKFDAKVETCSILLFNLALAFQLSEVSNGETSMRKNLKQCINLYEIVLSLIPQPHRDINISFTIAVVNNLGLAHRFLNESASATTMFQHLLTLLMFLTYSRAEKISHFDEFFLTASTYMFEINRTAAAA